MRDVVIVKNSSAPYIGARWGDYSGVSCDPSDDRTFWMNHEYTPGDNIWNTWISRCIAPNNPPLETNITGPAYGKPNVEYEFCIYGVDPEHDNIFCIWDWGDGSYSDWQGPYSSGEQICVHKSWPISGTYEIRVKLRDDLGFETKWSDPFVIIIDGIYPSVQIIKPTNAIYINNNKIIPFFVTIIIGYISVEISALDELSGIEKVEFFVDSKLKGNDTTFPYRWTWDENLFFKHKLEVVIYDRSGNQNSEKLTVWKFT
jgi:hypothetical protein